MAKLLVTILFVEIIALIIVSGFLIKCFNSYNVREAEFIASGLIIAALIIGITWIGTVLYKEK